MISVINFLKKFGFGRGKLKFLNSFILKQYFKRNNITSINYNYFGKKFVLFPMDNATDNKMIISSKKYEDEELIFLKNLKKNNKSIFLDIGANMGYYSIMSSFNSKLINDTYLFTDSPKYEKVATQYGVKFPFKRDKYNAKDTSSDSDVIKEFLEKYFLYYKNGVGVLAVYQT